MQEKEMVLDVLSGTKASLNNYSKAITECANQNLRTTLQQMRDGDEKFQYDLFKLAEQKGYYGAPNPASPQDTTDLKATLTQAATALQGGGPVPSMF